MGDRVCAVGVAAVIMGSLAGGEVLAGLLRWAPPGLDNPVIVELGPDQKLSTLMDDRDYIIRLPADQPYTRALHIIGGRNVVLIGGHISLPNLDGVPDVWDSDKRAIYIKNNVGTVHIEGVLIEGAGEYDGVAIDADDSIVQLQNIRVNDVRGTVDTFHGDIVQPWGGVKELRIDYLTGSTYYQGLQIDRDLGPIGKELISHVNLTGEGRYKIWLTKNDPPPELIRFEEVYITPRPGVPLDRSVWPESTDPQFGAVLSEDGMSITWPNLPFVEGSVLLGPPPGGDFVPEGVAGLGYQSPGYVPEPGMASLICIAGAMLGRRMRSMPPE